MKHTVSVGRTGAHTLCGFDPIRFACCARLASRYIDDTAVLRYSTFLLFHALLRVYQISRFSEKII